MIAPIEIRSATFTPASTGATESKDLFNLKAGERVVLAGAQVLVAAAAATDSTMALGDLLAPDNYIAATDTEANAAGTIIPGVGANLAASGGKLAVADYAVAATYDKGTVAVGSTKPVYRFWIGVIDDLRAL